MVAYDSKAVDVRFLPSLSRCFSPVVLGDLISRGKSDYLTEIVHNSGIGAILDLSGRLRDFFDGLYDYLFRCYRSEYIYKNILAQQVYLGRHAQTSHMLTELRVASCKADVVVLNGTSTVYEIKSDLDSFDRLDSQISAYTNFFDNIYVVTSARRIEEVAKVLGQDIGIMALSEDGAVDTLRESGSHKAQVNPAIIFGTLRKHEYTWIIKETFGSVPDVPNTRLHDACLRLFKQLSSAQAHDAMMMSLQRRSNPRQLRSFFDAAPHSLKACATSVRFAMRDAQTFTELLDGRAQLAASPVHD